MFQSDFLSDFEKYKEISRKSFDAANKRRPTDCLEGINLNNFYISRRKLVSHLVGKCIQDGAILIRSPPSSGKTSLAQLMYLYLYEMSNVLPVSISCLNWPDEKSFEDSFGAKSGLGNSLVNKCTGEYRGFLYHGDYC
jgi:hypothetical protein